MTCIESAAGRSDLRPAQGNRERGKTSGRDWIILRNIGLDLAVRKAPDLLSVRKTRPVSYGWTLRNYFRAASIGLVASAGDPVVNKP